MEDYDIPLYEDDFEDRYADELEMMNELDDDNDNKRGPRKTLDFSDKDERTIYKNGFSQAVKRQIHDMYALLDNEDSDEEINNENGDDNTESQAKRPRMSTSPEKNSSFQTKNKTSTTDNESVKIIHETTAKQVKTNQTKVKIPKPTKVFTRPPLGKDCITITGCDQGKRVYLCLKDEDPSEQHNEANKFLEKRPNNLLGVPFHALVETIHEQRTKKLLDESRRITETLNSVVHDDLINKENDVDNYGSELEEKVGLWVDKYSPKTYVELLSDDGINRNLLSWLKIWDPIVFGKEKQKRKKTDEKQENRKDKFKKFNKDEDTDWMEPDSTGRPVKKIALLCGAPGLGKTTLAHIVSEHAGYSVVEMNASDDRSVDVFRNKIESATQMQSVLDSGKKPNCLIIDEIDGAPTPAINVLLSLIKSKDTDSSNQPKKKKKKRAEMLSRPIICICNDPYVPALRLLRQQAFVLTFPPTLSARLAQRLMQVSRKEILRTDMRALLALCEKAENDIRSCLNTLQFLRKNQQHLTIDYVRSATIGQKDSQKSLFFIWQSVFQLPRTKKKLTFPSNFSTQKDNPLTTEITAAASRFYNMLHLASSNGQYNKLENGLFENYLNMKFKDSRLRLVVSATEWLEFADIVSQSLREQQNFVLMRYQPFLSVAFHMFFAGTSQPKLNYPSVGYENTVKEAMIVNIISSMLNGVSNHLRGMLDTRVIAAELLPFLISIITPTLRPVNTQLFSESEKKQLMDLINIMIDYNLTFHQERTMEGFFSYILDPKVEDVIKFPGMPQHKHLTYATKQLIAREIDLEKMRRKEKVIMGKNILTNEGKVKEKTSKTQSSVVLDYKPKEIKPDAKQERDFFGRPVIPKRDENGDLCQENNNRKSKSPFWFKFQEGFSNAVRRTIKIQELL